MEQIPRKGAKIENSKSGQKQDDGRPRHHPRDMAQWDRAMSHGCATWRGHVPASVRSLA